MKSFKAWLLENMTINWNALEHPRAPKGSVYAGQWVNKFKISPFLALPPPRPSHPDLADVEGDDWNKLTALRLDREYLRAKPFLDELLKDAEGKDVLVKGTTTYSPEEWEQLTQEQQDATYEKWKENNYDEFYQSEVDNWQENTALDDAMYQLSQEDTYRATYPSEWLVPEWLDDALDAYKDDFDGVIPYSNLDLAKALTIEYDTGHYPPKKGLDIDFDDSELNRPTDLEYDPEKQMEFPGIEHEPPSSHLTKEMREGLIERITDAFISKAEDLQTDLDPPDYLSENVDEYMEQYWDEMSDSKKFEYAKDYDLIGDVDLDSDIHNVEIPDKFDPLNNNDDKDYKNTQLLAKYLSINREIQIFKERGIKAKAADIEAMDSKLWRGWVGSSNSVAGRLLQIACSEELGARFNSDRIPDETKQSIIKNANADYSEYKEIGGFAGIKAIVRAKWEVTQFLLEKAGINKVKVYRGIDYPEAYGSDNKKFDFDVKPSEMTITFRKYEGPIQRNGCLSTSLNDSVSNKWGPDDTRVVLRIEAPRTAVVSIPAYGENEHHERELVVAGTAWSRWDAWKKTAPKFNTVPFGVKGKPIPPKPTQKDELKIKYEESWAGLSYGGKADKIQFMLQVMEIKPEEITKLVNKDLTKYETIMDIINVIADSTVKHSTNQELYNLGNSYLKSLAAYLNHLYSEPDKKETKNDSKAA